MEYTGWTWGCMGRSVGHFSHMELPFLGSFTPGLMMVTEQEHSAPSIGVPVPRSVLCSQSEVFHVLENGLGRVKSISTALVCAASSIWPTGSPLGHSCAVSQALFIPVPHVLISVLGMEGTAQHRSVPQGESPFSLQHSYTVLSTFGMVSGVSGSLQP